MTPAESRSPLPAIAAACVLLSCLGARTACGQQPPRFEARFSDGTYLLGDLLEQWHTQIARPQLENRPLLATDNRVRWLVNRRLQPSATPRSFVESVAGDRFPGEVVGYVAAATDSMGMLPEHFLVRPAVSLRPPQQTGDRSADVRVLRSHVRRIVWQKTGRDYYEPSVLIYRDGRRQPYRAVRFAEQSVSLLVADGQQRVSFDEIAELHLPLADFWDGYYNELAVLSPDCSADLIQLETSNGLTLTSSLARLRAYANGNPRESDRWVHGLQPAWCLDMLWVPNDDVRVRRVFSPHEVPLSRIPPAAHQQHNVFATSAPPWQVNSSVQGGPLRSGGHEAGWGLGVHASSQLEFSLPKEAESFRAEVGLDQAAGSGGCVTAKVSLPAAGEEPLFASPPLVGSGQRVDTGVLALKRAAAGSRLVLQIDMAHKQRPAGADPFDIRDLADWLDPTVRLNQDLLRREIRQRLSRQVAAWNEWSLELDSRSRLQPAHVWNELAPPPGMFEFGVSVSEQPLRLVHRRVLADDDRWLVLAATRQVASVEPPRLSVHVDGATAAEFDVPLRDRTHPDGSPLVVSLAKYRRDPPAEVRLEIRQYPQADSVPVCWQAIQIAPRIPTLFALFDEDEGPFVSTTPQPEGAAVVEQQGGHSGTRSLKVMPDGQFRLDVPALEIREHPTWGQYRFLRFAFRKVGEGRISLELNTAGERREAVRYDAGLGEPAHGQAKRVWLEKLPDRWIVITRDLFADFGEFNVAGLTLSSPDGQHALFDHVYLARVPGDFDLVSAREPNRE